jgi:hypothetical protein
MPLQAWRAVRAASCPGGSLYDLIRARQQRGRDREADGAGGLAIDPQLERDGVLDRQIAGLSPLRILST